MTTSTHHLLILDLFSKLNLYNESNIALIKELALVKMYEVVLQNRVSRLIDCIELRW